MAGDNLSFFWDRFSRIRNNGNAQSFRGLEIREAVDSEGGVLQVVTMGPHNPHTRGRQHNVKAIEVAAERGLRPRIVEGKIVSGRVDRNSEDLRFIRDDRNESSVRIFRTGLIMRGSDIQQDLADLRADGKKLRWHGAFALDVGSAVQIGEGETIQVRNNAQEIADDHFGKLRGLPGVPYWRERGFEIPEGGAVICGDIGRELTVHERKNGRVLIWDVSNDPDMQKLFERLAEAELENQRKIIAAARSARQAKRSATADGAIAGDQPKLPVGHPDA